MRIRFRVGDGEAEGRTRDLSTHGTFVLTDRSAEPTCRSAIDLLLETNSDSLKLAGQVVRVTAEGFAVAFDCLPTDTLIRLHGLLHGEPEPAGGVRSAPTIPRAGSLSMPVQGEDWSPPVSEPVLHQWRPEKDLVQPAATGQVHSSWEGFPTLAVIPAGQTPAQKPGGAARPTATTGPSPEEKAQQLLENLNGETAGAAPQPQPQTPGSEPADEDQRQSERFDRSIPVSFENLTGLIKEFTHNISYGGMFVYAHQPQPLKSPTAVTLIHPVHGERLTLLAKVVHASDAPTPDPVGGQPRYGLGLEFSLPLDELKRVLADFIGSHQRQDDSPAAPQVVADAKVVLERGKRSRHALLGVPTNAGKDAIRRAYFKLVDRFHPDRYFGKIEDADRRLLADLFRLLTKAYEDLTA